MIKKLLLGVVSLIVVLVAVAGGMYVTNWAPTVPAISAADASNAAKPYVVKMHAKWCPVCMVTKGMWTQIESTYAGRVNLLVFDFTNATTTAASRIEAKRLGLERYFDAHEGWTGAVVVLDARTKEEKAAIQGSREFADYREAIDAALAPRSVSLTERRE